MVQNKEDIIKIITAQNAAIHKLGAKRIGLFGSFIRNEQNDKSDIDIVVEFQDGMKKYNNLLDLIDLLEGSFNRKVDLLTWEGMASFIQKEVKKNHSICCHPPLNF